MKRVLYWIGLLMLVGVALMPDVLVPPLASAGDVLAQGSTQQTPREQQYSDLTEADLISKGCTLHGIVGEDLPKNLYVSEAPEGTKIYWCPDSPKVAKMNRGLPPCPDEAFVYPNGTVEKFVTACAHIAEPTEDPQGPPTGKHRVQRGGGFTDHFAYSRSACRAFGPPAQCQSWLGFRVVVVGEEAIKPSD